MKFGGSSVGNAERIAGVRDIVLSAKEPGVPLVVVCSAMSGVTDMLIAMSAQASAGDLAYQDALLSLRARHIDSAR
ncbi:MAG: aspartate kinase, partial [Bdellovibrionota bacterium]